MSEIPAPIPAPDPAAGSPPSRGIPATLVPQPPTVGSPPPGPGISALLLPTPGQPLKATVLESRATGHLILATAGGALEVVARQPIPPGTQILVLARQSAGGNALVLLPEAEAGAVVIPRPGPPNPTKTNPGQVLPGQVLPGQVLPSRILPNQAPEIAFQPLRLQALVQRAAAPGQPVDLAGRPLPQIPTGGRLSLQILAITPASPRPAGNTAGASPSAIAPTPIPGTQGLRAAGSPPPGAAIQFYGQVTGKAPDGRPLIATPAGTLLLDRPANLPPGAGLLIALDGPVLAPSALERGSLPARLPLTWPILSEVLAAEPAPEGATTNPANPGTTAASPSLPQTGGRLTSGLLFFLSALRGGDLAGWLEAAALNGRDPAKLGALGGRLGQEAGQAARQAEQVLGDWRLIPIPLLHEGRIEPLHLLIRRRRSGAPADEEADATRFLLEVELSALGELQLDGLTRGRRFDLILRSRRPLSTAMRRDVTEIFENANAVGGTRGQIAFHASSNWSFLAKRLTGSQASESLTV